MIEADTTPESTPDLSRMAHCGPTIPLHADSCSHANHVDKNKKNKDIMYTITTHNIAIIQLTTVIFALLRRPLLAHLSNGIKSMLNVCLGPILHMTFSN